MLDQRIQVAAILLAITLIPGCRACSRDQPSSTEPVATAPVPAVENPAAAPEKQALAPTAAPAPIVAGTPSKSLPDQVRHTNIYHKDRVGKAFRVLPATQVNEENLLHLKERSKKAITNLAKFQQAYPRLSKNNPTGKKAPNPSQEIGQLNKRYPKSAKAGKASGKKPETGPGESRFR